MRSTLIITTYFQPRLLPLVLSSVASQMVKPEQIIVADDGTKPGLSLEMLSWKKKLPIDYVWQSDQGFRAARVRNLALAKVRHEHVIMIDGDCLIPSNFVMNHQNLSKKKTIVAGSRVLLNKDDSLDLLEKGFDCNQQKLFQNKKFLSLPLGFFRDVQKTNWKLARTCNLSAHTDDLLAVDGFDEAYVGWGREDSDLVVRMINNGCSIRSGRMAVCAQHIYHQPESRHRLSRNDRLLRDVLEFCRFNAKKSILKDI
jgi:glycosyltransferase involved in cell wall biosynthesis